jgi:hypothetical protein
MFIMAIMQAAAVVALEEEAVYGGILYSYASHLAWFCSRS